MLIARRRWRQRHPLPWLFLQQGVGISKADKLQTESAQVHNRKERARLNCGRRITVSNYSADWISYLHPHPAPCPGFLPASCSTFLPSTLHSATSGLFSQATTEAANGAQIPPCASQTSHLPPALPSCFVQILRRGDKVNSCGKRTSSSCGTSACAVWGENRRETRKEMFCSFIPVHISRQLTHCFFLLPSITRLNLFPCSHQFIPHPWPGTMAHSQLTGAAHASNTPPTPSFTLFSLKGKESYFVFNVSYLKIISTHKRALLKDK